jgi:hypothetical protein
LSPDTRRIDCVESAPIARGSARFVEEHLHDLPIDVFIYVPRADALAPEHRDVEAMRRPRLTREHPTTAEDRGAKGP